MAVSFVPMAAVSEVSASVTDAIERPFSEVARGYTAFRNNDVLFAKITPCMENGKVAIARNLRNHVGFGSTEFHVIRAGERVIPEYLWFFMRTREFRDEAKSRMVGAGGQQRVPADFVSSASIPLPHLPEQHRIVEILGQADALRQQRRQADEISRKIAPALFHDAFGDLRRNPRNWETLALGQVAEIVSGITKGRRTSETSLREIAYLSVANVQDGHLRLANVKRISASEAEIERFRLMRDDLVLTEGGDPDKLGRGALWTGEMNECIHQNHVFRVRVASPKILPTFLAALTGSEYGKAYFLSVAKKTTGIASINKTQLSAFPVVIPPLGIQQRFVDAMSSLNDSSDSQATSATTLETLFQTLLHRAFDGSLTAKWREAHAKELLQEMEHQAILTR